jgi:hypothetical protein
MRSFLFDPWDGSRIRSWIVACVVAAPGVAGGLLIHGSSSVAGAPIPVPASAPWPPAGLQLVRSRQPGLRVLFIGNSFTAANGMVAMVQRLAATNRPHPLPMLAVEYDPGGSTLRHAASDPALRQLLSAARWNVVVLQEQSQTPALMADWLRYETIPAVDALNTMIRRDGARPLLFETCGYQSGDLDNFANDSYTAMQSRLHAGYMAMAAPDRIRIAPVGDAWAQAIRMRPNLPLWAADGKHPSVEGSYLAAAVLTTSLDTYAGRVGSVISPQPSPYTAGLDPGTAVWLQRIALHIAAPAATR